MATIDNPIYNEIISILGSGPKPVNHKWKVVFHTPEEDIEAFRVVSMNVDRNYVDNYTDEITLEVMLTKGQYDFKIFPHRNNIQVSVTRSVSGEIGAGVSEGSGQQAQRFAATLMEFKDNHITAPSPVVPDADSAGLDDLKTYRFQLLDLSIRQLRLMSVGGIYRDTSPIDTVRYLLGKTSKMVDLPEDLAIRGVDVAMGGNGIKRKHVIVPHHTNLITAPRYIHEKQGGCYSTGFGYYMQNRLWYVYPTYHLRRFDNARKALTVLSVPSNMMPGVERTYRQDGTQLYVLSTGDVQHRDESELLQLNRGNGIRYANADKLFESFVEVEGNRATASRTNNNVEVMSSFKTTGMDFINLSREKVTSNHLLQYSKLAAREGAFVQFVWENANMFLITPGMATRFLFPVGGRLKEVYGTVISAEYYVQMAGEGLTNPFYTTTASITLFIEREPRVV